MKTLRLSYLIPTLALALATSTAWGSPVQAPGLPHLQQVTNTIYRGAQPTAEGWKSLADLGIKVVIDLRREGEDGEHSTAAEAKAVQAAGMRYVHVPMNGIVAPGDAQIAKVMAHFNSGEPVFVHCKKGKDRTGTVIACYRIAKQGWENKKALDEAKSLGMHWVEVGMKRYINSFRAPTENAANPEPAAAQ
jgi:uncharacterized protein (TIGR01244 family)